MPTAENYNVLRVCVCVCEFHVAYLNFRLPVGITTCMLYQLHNSYIHYDYGG